MEVVFLAIFPALISLAVGKFADLKSECDFGHKTSSFTLVGNQTRDYLIGRCENFQHPQCTQKCQWISSCRNMAKWNDGNNHFVAGVKLKTKGTKPRVRTYEVKCCESENIDILDLSCNWTEIRKSRGREAATLNLAKGAALVIRDLRHVVKDGEMVFEAEVCKLRQKWCVLRQPPREGVGFATANSRLAKLLPESVQGFPVPDASSFLQPPLLPPNLRRAPMARIEGPVAANPIGHESQIFSDVPAACSVLSIMSYGDVSVKPTRKLVNARGSAVRLSCNGPELQRRVLDAELAEEPELAGDLALFPSATSKPMLATCSRGGVWEVEGGVPLETDCTHS